MINAQDSGNIVDLINEPRIWEIVFSTLVFVIYVFALFNNFMSRIEPRHRCVRELSHKIEKELAKFWKISFLVGALAEEESSEQAFLNLRLHKYIQNRVIRSLQRLNGFVSNCKLFVIIFACISLVLVICMIFSSNMLELLYRKLIWLFFAVVVLAFTVFTFLLERYFIRKEHDAKKWDTDLKRLHDSTISEFPFLRKAIRK